MPRDKPVCKCLVHLPVLDITVCMFLVCGNVFKCGGIDQPRIRSNAETYCTVVICFCAHGEPTKVSGVHRVLMHPRVQS